MKRLAIILALAIPAAAQTTITTTTTVQMSNIARPGNVFADLADYGMALKVRDLNLVNNGYLPVPYYNISWGCTTGGTQSTTNFFSNITGSVYPANFFQNYTFKVVTAAGASKGTGTVTASTDNTSTGINFTLGTAISSACTTGGSTAQDIIVLNPPSTPSLTSLSFSEYFSGHTSGTCTFESTDVLNSNYKQALDCPSGVSIAFALDATVGQPQNTVSTTAVPYINFNGTYTTMLAAENISGCSVSYSVSRVGGTTFQSGTVTPSSWTTYNPTFTASETGAQTTTAQLNISTSGHCRLQYMSVIESSTDVANTTILRDDVFHVLQKMAPGSLRFMGVSDWGADANHLTNTSYGLTGTPGFNPFVRNQTALGLNYNDRLNICKALPSVKHCWITGGNWAPPSDYALLATWLNTSGWNTAAASAGFDIPIEYGNEAWNSATPVDNLGGNGISYGYMGGLVVNAFKTASGYSSSVDKIVLDGWSAGSQSYGIFGWIQNVLNTAGCTISVRTFCPDYVDAAYYTLNELDSLTDVFKDEVAENYNIATKNSYSTSGSFMSAKQTNAYTLATWNVPLAEYEYQYSPTSGTATPTQAQMNQISASSGNGLIEYEHALLLLQQAGLTGPINEFSFADQPSNNSINSTQHTAWSCMRLMPGAGGTDVYQPTCIYETVGNTAIGSNNCLMSSSQSGTPTFNYAGGQGSSIDTNAAVPYVTSYVFADCATKSNWTILAFNHHESSTQPITFSFAASPVGTVTKTVVGGSTNALTDNNNNTNLTNNGTAAPMVLPTSGTFSGTTDTLPIGSMTAYTFSSSGTPTAGTPTFSPVAGSYGPSQTVTISVTGGAPVICYSTTTTPATNGAAGCTTGTLYTAPVTVSASSTLHAIAGGTGFLDGTPSTAAYVINGTAATPTFSPVAGTYSSSQNVTISTSTGSATICYTTDGSTPLAATPGTCSHGTTYSGAVTVATTQTLMAIATKVGFTNSSVGSAAYTITASSPGLKLSGVSISSGWTIQ